MSWAIKIAGHKKDVPTALRNVGLGKGVYPDAQRDSVLENAAKMIEAMEERNAPYNGVLVEGSGHQGSNYAIRVDHIEVVPDLPPTIVNEDRPATAA